MHLTIHSKEHNINFDEHCLNELSQNSYVTQFNRRTSIILALNSDTTTKRIPMITMHGIIMNFINRHRVFSKSSFRETKEIISMCTI